MSQLKVLFDEPDMDLLDTVPVKSRDLPLSSVVFLVKDLDDDRDRVSESGRVFLKLSHEGSYLCLSQNCAGVITYFPPDTLLFPVRSAELRIDPRLRLQ